MRNLWLMGLTLGLVTPAAAQVTVTPRFSGYFDNGSQQQSVATAAADQGAAARIDETSAALRDLFGPDAGYTVVDGDIVSGGDQIFYPLAGASISVPIGGETTLATVTALYGKANSTVRAVTRATQRITVAGVTAEDLLVASTTGRLRLKRLDLEATVQHRIGETFSLIGGLRYERVSEKLALSGDFTATQNGTNLVRALTGDPNIDLGLAATTIRGDSTGISETYSVRAGGAAYVPIGERQSLYVNGLLHLSHVPSEDNGLSLRFVESGQTVANDTRTPGETSAGPDISVGYLLRFGERLGIDLRYRGTFYFPLSGPRDFSDPRVNHGFNVGVSITL